MSVKIIAVSHGRFSEGLVDSVQMLAGEQKDLVYYGLFPEETVDDLREKLRAELEATPEDMEVLFLSDVFHGSPFNTVVDDEVANDSFNKRVIKALAPNGVKCNVYSVEKGADILQRPSKEASEKVMVLTKTPNTYAKLVDLGCTFEGVNLGGMGLRGERKPFIKNVACAPDEIESIKHLMDKGVHVYYQLVPEQQVIKAKDYV